MGSISNLKEEPPFLKQCISFIIAQISAQSINRRELLKFLSDHYSWTFFAFNNRRLQTGISPTDMSIICEQGHNASKVAEGRLHEFSVLIIAYIYDNLTDKKIDLQDVIEHEVFSYDTNQYHLSYVNDAVFKRDGLIFDHKGYYYNPLLRKTMLDQYDDTVGFAKIINDEAGACDIRYRLDENLGIPEDSFTDYSGVGFQKIYGPQFHFNDTSLSTLKTITVHCDSKMNKLIMVIKRVINEQPQHWDVEIETLPVPNDCDMITTFLHGMYFPDEDVFTHIDLARNQYNKEAYCRKYMDSNDGISIDHYTENRDLHYKIWCIENGRFSRTVWYKLMAVSLGEYKNLLDEILA